MDVPDLIPFDHWTENESNRDDDDNIGKGNNLQILYPFVHRHGNYVTDDDSDCCALQESAVQENSMRSMCNPGLMVLLWERSKRIEAVKGIF